MRIEAMAPLAIKGDEERLNRMSACLRLAEDLDVPAERDGYVLKILGRSGETASVGSVLLWLGEIAGEQVAEQAPAALVVSVAGGTERPTAKAREMLRELDLAAAAIPAAGESPSQVTGMLNADLRRRASQASTSA